MKFHFPGSNIKIYYLSTHHLNVTSKEKGRGRSGGGKVDEIHWILKLCQEKCGIKFLLSRSNMSYLKLKLQYFGHLMQRVNLLEKTLMLGGIAAGEGDDRGWDGWMASLTRWTWVWVNSGSWWWTGRPGLACCNSWSRKESETTERLIWTELKMSYLRLSIFIGVCVCV